MRPVLHGDVSNAARALLSVPHDQRLNLCQTLMAQAEQADAYVLKNRRLHPEWGNGSLMAVARKYPLSVEPTFDDPDYCACFALVLSCLRAATLSRTHS